MRVTLFCRLSVIPAVLLFFFSAPIAQAATSPSLGAAGSYAVLANTYTNTTPGTTVIGDIGFATAPALAPVGTHTHYGSVAPYTAAGADQAAALTALNAQPCTFTWGGAVELGADATHGPMGIFTPGVYCAVGAMAVTTSITLNGKGTYIFRSVGAFNMAAVASVGLTNGATVNDVFWTPTGATVIGAGASLYGNILTNAAITFGAATALTGRALAFNNTITQGAVNYIASPVVISTSPAILHVIKRVINTNANTAASPSFTLHVKTSGIDVTGSPAAGADLGTSYALAPGTYVINEEANPGYIYTQVTTGDCDATGHITLAFGDDKTCVITNTVTERIPTIWLVPGNGSGTCTTINPNCTTIQAAINASSQGDVITVLAGTNNEILDIPHGITLNGANAGINPNAGTRTAETILTAGGHRAIRISTTDPIVIDGFTFDGTAVPIDSYTSSNNVTIQNNIIKNTHCDAAGCMIFFPNSKTLVLKNNHFTNLDPNSNDAIQIQGNWDGSSGTVVNITGNVMENSIMTGINANNISGTIASNTFSNLSYYGLLIAGNSGSLNITGNTFTKISNPDPTNATWGAGIRFYIPTLTGPVSITGNTFTANAIGVAIRRDAAAHDLSNIIIEKNAFSGNTISIINDAPLDTQLNATHNWWGDKSGPKDMVTNDGSTPNLNIAGLGGAATGAVNYSGWCLDATCVAQTVTAVAPPIELLGTAATYGVLAKTYTNPTAGTTVIGDIGFITGPTARPLGVHTNYGSAAPYAQAGADQAAALAVLNAKPCTFSWIGAIELSADVLHGPAGVYAPGVYCSNGAMSLTTAITLSGKGTYIFRAIGALGTAAASSVTLANGASAKDVYWAPTGATAFGAAATFVGTIISDAGITFGAADSLQGRALAFNGSVTNGAANEIIAPVSPPATLHVITQVINDNTGTRVAAQFQSHVLLAGTDVIGSPAAGNASPGTTYSLASGNFVITQDASAGYTTTFSEDCDANGNISLASGDNKTCTIINDDIVPIIPPASINVVKVVINIHGGTKTVADFPLFVNGTPVVSGDTNIFAAPASYAVTETNNAKYLQTFSGDCDATGHLTLVPGDGKFCIITNTDIAPVIPPATITVSQVMINDNGGSKSLSTFPIFVNNKAVVNGATNVYPAPATYSVMSYGISAPGDYSYTLEYSGDCDAGGHLTLAPGDAKYCIATYNDVAPIIPPATITVSSLVLNNYGGTKSPSDFPLHVNTTLVTSTVTNIYAAPATYTISGATDSHYTQHISGDCDTSGRVSLAPGDAKYCVVTYSDIAPVIPPATLSVATVVIDDNGGTKTVNDFSLFVNNTQVMPSLPIVYPAPATYTVTGTINAQYTQSFSGDCDASGHVSLIAGDTKHCIVTYNDIAPVIPPATINVTTVVINNNGGNKSSVDFSARINGTAVTNGTTTVYPAPAAYIVSATTDSYYTQAFSGDCDSSGHVSLVPGDNKFCVITYNDIAPVIPRATINVTRIVINDHSGTKTSADFSTLVNGTAVTNGTTTIFPAPASYIVSGSTDPKYTQAFSGDCDSSGHVSLVPGDNKFCVITYNDIADVIIPHPTTGTINVTSIVVNNNGGTKTTADFSLTINGTAVSPNIANVFPAPATYTIAGSTNTQYTKTYSGDCDTTGRINLVPTDAKYCVVTYNDIAPIIPPATINVTSVVVNNNGGTKTASDFSLTMNSAPIASHTTTIFPAPAAYVIAGSTNAQYTKAYSGDCDATGHLNLIAGDAKYCIVTYNDIAPVIPPATINVTSVVFNNHGGTKTAGDFSLFVDGSSVVSNATNIFSAPATHIVSGATSAQYAQSISGDCTVNGNVSLVAGDAKSCIITYSDIAPTIPPAVLNVASIVINNNGGTKTTSDFSLFINGIPTISGTPKTLIAPTTVTVTASTNTQYTQTFSGDCNNTGRISLTPGLSSSCVITYNDIAPIIPPSSTQGTITVTSVVINNNGGTKTASDFSLTVNGATVAAGATSIFAAASYTISGSANASYTQTFSGDCDNSGKLIVTSGKNTTCLVTYNDIAPTIVTTPTAGGSSASNYSSGSQTGAAPLIDIVKIPTPFVLPNGPGSIMYTYTLRNIGTVPVSNITMLGDTCNAIYLVSGDLNANAILDVNEKWIYSCYGNLQETHTGTIVATGWANGMSTTDIASTTVIVGKPTIAPLIHVVKVPSTFLLPIGGGQVTYTEKVSNPGTVALSNIHLTDDTCSPMKFASGDINNNTKLDPTETWTYTCRKNLTSTTTNTATAVGEANGLTIRDFAIATVVVSNATAPTQSSTGNFAPFATTLRPGTTSADVKRLQQFLNAQGHVLSGTSFGSLGKETTFYGDLTTDAVKLFQEHFAAQLLQPRKLTKGTGIFDEQTRVFVNQLIQNAK